MTVRALPIYKIDNREYFRDERLGEYRLVTNPNVSIPIAKGDRMVNQQRLKTE